MTTRCGFVALMGRPNAGKSTLLNALVGEKLAVVSRKPQTTRNRILGVTPEGMSQIILLDSPGLHRARGTTRLNTTLNRVAMATGSEADLILYLVDAKIGVDERDMTSLKRILETTEAPVMIVATKQDAIKKTWALLQAERIGDAMGELSKNRFLHPLPRPLSAKRPEDVNALKREIAALLPEGPWLFDEDALTDRPQNFLCAELVREQMFRQLGDEIPYGCAVRIVTFQEKPGITVVEAQIVVSRQQHKGMVVGKRGAKIKEIGMAARTSLEKHLGRKVFLDLAVCVQEGWTNDEASITDLAHLTEAEL